MKKFLSVMLALALVCSCALAFADGALKIGVIGPMTGPAADYGLACQRRQRDQRRCRFHRHRAADRGRRA